MSSTSRKPAVQPGERQNQHSKPALEDLESDELIHCVNPNYSDPPYGSPIWLFELSESGETVTKYHSFHGFEPEPTIHVKAALTMVHDDVRVTIVTPDVLEELRNTGGA